MRGDNDLELVRESILGSEKAFRRIIEMHQPVVYSVVRGILGNRAEVDDTVQEIFIKIYRGLPSFRGDSRLSTWIYRIARNESLNAYSRTRHDPQPIEEMEHLASADGNPDEVYGKREIRERLENLLSRLEEHYRVVLELRYMGEKSYMEIAKIMDIPVGTVKTYIYRAKASLKKMLAGSESEKTLGGNRER